MDITKQQASRHLGQTVGEYKTTYAPELLVAVERVHNRTKYNIDEQNLPFVGYDTWNAYEVSFLLDNGFPVSGVAKISYACNSACIVESKSLKLYLNSFNMTKFGRTKELAVEGVEKTIANDLSKLLETEVTVALHFEATNGSVWPNYKYEGFRDIESFVDVTAMEFNTYEESPEILEVETSVEHSKVLRISTNLLRSNCRITSQPDWGDAYIHISGENMPSIESLLQYIVSFRKEDHFHEEVCEMLYKRLWDKYQPEELMVTCLYTRRGGIDICPARANKPELLSDSLQDVTRHVAKTLRQ